MRCRTGWRRSRCRRGAAAAAPARPGAAALRQHGRAAACSGVALSARRRALRVLLCCWPPRVWWLNVRGDERHGRRRRRRRRRAQVERGAYLARAGNCQDCHTPRGARALFRRARHPHAFWHGLQLEPDARCATGIGDWTAAQFRRAMHNGRSRDGRLLYPAFPYDSSTRIARDDADALFAYLRSLPAVAQPNQAHELALSLRHAGRAGGVARTVLPARPFRGRSRAVARMEPRRLPGAGPGPLQRLPRQPQCAGRDARCARPGGRADPAAELVRAGLERGAKPAGRLARGRRRAAEDRRVATARRCSGRWPRWCCTARSI